MSALAPIHHDKTLQIDIDNGLLFVLLNAIYNGAGDALFTNEDETGVPQVGERTIYQRIVL